MIDEIVGSIQAVLKGAPFQQFSYITSDLSYLQPCQLIIENDETFDSKIRFNAFLILADLIQKFYSQWSLEEVQAIDSWFISILENNPKSISIQQLLLNGFGKSYALLIRSQERKGEQSISNFFAKFLPIIMGKTQLHRNTALRATAAILDNISWDYDIKSINYIVTTCFEILGKFVSGIPSDNTFSVEDAAQAVLVTSILEILYTILKRNKISNSFPQFDEVKKFSIIMCPDKTVSLLISPQFVGSYLDSFYNLFSDDYTKYLCLEICFCLSSFSSYQSCHDQSTLYRYIISFLSKIIQNKTYTDEGICQICRISYKVRMGLDQQKIKEYKQIYIEFFQLFGYFCCNTLYNVEMFFSKPEAIQYSLSFWAFFDTNFNIFVFADIKELIRLIAIDIMKKFTQCVFDSLLSDTETAINILDEKDHTFYLISELASISRLGIYEVIVEFYISLLNDIFSNYRNNGSNEILLYIMMYISSSLFVKNNDKNQGNDFQIGYPLFATVLNIINQTGQCIESYAQIHENDIPYLEKSILDFIYFFSFTAFCGLNYGKDYYSKFSEDLTEMKVVELFYYRIDCDFKLFASKSLFILNSAIDSLLFYKLIDDVNPKIYENFIFNEFQFINIGCRKRYNKSIYNCFVKAKKGNFLEKLINNFHTNLHSYLVDKKYEKLNSLFVDIAPLFKHATDDKEFSKLYSLFFPQEFIFFERNSSVLLTDPQYAPQFLIFWHSIVHTRGSKIKFGKHSANGILLFKHSANILLVFFDHLKKYGNDTNLSNYSKCFTRALHIFNHLIGGSYVMFDAFRIFKDDIYILSIKSIIQTLAQFDLKTMFDFPKLGNELAAFARVLIEKRKDAFFTLQDLDILLLIHILECSIFAPNRGNCNLDFLSLSNLIKIIINNRQSDIAASIIQVSHNTFERINLEMWQTLFITENRNLILYTSDIIFCLLELDNQFFEQIKNVILPILPEDLLDYISSLLEENSESFQKRSLEELNTKIRKNYPFELKFYDEFPLNWHNKK